MPLTILSRNDVTNLGMEVGAIKQLLRIRAQETAWQIEQLSRRPKGDGARVKAELGGIAREYRQPI